MSSSHIQKILGPCYSIWFAAECGHEFTPSTASLTGQTNLMAENDLKTIESRVNFASKLLTLAFKVGVLLGGACLLFYCYRLNYFPIGLSVGDGFLLILLATSFGIVYGLFVISLTALGLWLTPFLRPIQRLVFSIRKRFAKHRQNDPLELISPDLNAVIFGFFGIAFIGVIYQAEPSAIWTLPATSFLLGVIFSAYQKSSLKLGEVLKAETAIITPVAKAQVLLLDKERLRTTRTLSLIALFATPLLVGGVSEILLESGMRFAGIKKGPSYVMLRAPYSTFIPSNFQAKQAPQVPDFTTFEGVDVMFSGMGQKSVIEFKNDKKAKRLEIPNESILVVPR